METINDRMQQIADVYYGGNKAAFAKAIGIAPTSITNYIGKQRASKPSSDLLEKIVNSLDVDAMWLLTGKGDLKRKQIEDGLLFPKEDINNEVNILKEEIARLRDLLNAKNSTPTKVVVEFDVTPDEFIKMGLKDKIVQVLDKK